MTDIDKRQQLKDFADQIREVADLEDDESCEGLYDRLLPQFVEPNEVPTKRIYHIVHTLRVELDGPLKWFSNIETVKWALQAAETEWQVGNLEGKLLAKALGVSFEYKVDEVNWELHDQEGNEMP